MICMYLAVRYMGQTLQLAVRRSQLSMDKIARDNKSKPLRMTLSSHLPTRDGISLTPNTRIRIIGVIINQDLRLDTHIKQISDIILYAILPKLEKSCPSKMQKTNPCFYYILTYYIYNILHLRHVVVFNRNGLETAHVVL